ncbi:MAG: amino acid adenylation domain-containing protein [Acidobacteriota bacterium]|nr:amino acid adenylation domain-containing protein [Acidobacteriota bacterium]
MTGEVQGYRLSSQQRRVWSLWQSDRTARAWCVLRIDGDLNAGLLHAVAQGLAASHEILRTTFPRRPGMRTPVQTVREGVSIDWVEAKLSSGVCGLVDAADELARQDLEKPLDLEVGPLFRLRLAVFPPSSHLLFFSLPALCADRTSLHLLARELFRGYGEREAGRAAETAIQYADYAQWQYDLRAADDEPAAAARKYWSTRSEPAETSAWNAIPRGHGEAGRGQFSLPATTGERIDDFCRSLGATPSDFLLACVQVLLARATATSVGFVRAVHGGRRLEDLENAIGLFSAALPATLDLSPTTKFSDAVAEVLRTRLLNEEWQDYFDSADIASSPGTRAPAGFEFFDRPVLNSKSGLAISVLRESARVDEFPVDIVCEREGASIHVACTSGLSDEGGPSGAWIAEHLAPLIAGAANNPQERALSLPLLSDAERRRLIVDFNTTAAQFPSDRTLHELFETQVASSGDFPAVVFEGRRLSYRELNARANALAWVLRKRGVGPDVVVGLGLERSAEMIVALLGIWKAGGAYVPLIPDHPPARLAQQLSQSGCRLLITDSNSRGAFAGFDGDTLDLDADRDALKAAPTGNPPRGALPSSLAYVLFTSGSTGVPKGVSVRHQSLVNYAHFVARDLLGIVAGTESPLAFATVSTIGADLGNTAIFPALITGGTLHVISYDTAVEGGRFQAYVSENPIDVLKIVPSHLSALLASAGPGVLPARMLILGGEALPWELVERIRSSGATAEIVNHYGPTETTVGSLTFRVPAVEAHRLSSTVPIGRPIANTRIFVLDPEGEPVPIGVPGELFIGGAGVAAGYRNLPEETAERFVPDVFPGSGGGRLYRTGDRVRILSDGAVEFLGRVDDQVKIRGFRIEPGEVASVLASHTQIREAAVLVREDVAGDRRIVAYVIPDRVPGPSPEDIRAWLRGRLPDYMVPSAVVCLRSLPLTANGKVDRRALPPPEHADAGRPYVTARTPSEEKVAATWQDVLRLERVGAEDNFFDLGGHSLLVTQVVARLRKIFRRDLPIRWLFEAPTVSELAGRIDASEQEDLARMLDDLEALPGTTVPSPGNHE